MNAIPPSRQDAAVDFTSDGGVPGFTPDDLLDLAEYFDANHSRYWKSLYALRSYVTAHGPIRMRDGRLCGFQPDGHSWLDEEVAAVMPSLIKSAEATFAGSQPDIERVIEMVTEEFPLMGFEVKRKVDTTAANAVIKAGGAAADLISPLKVSKSRLGVR